MQEQLSYTFVVLVVCIAMDPLVQSMVRGHGHRQQQVRDNGTRKHGKPWIPNGAKGDHEFALRSAAESTLKEQP
jgi:hypothetical protein